MIRFLIMYLTIYGGTHYYAFRKAKNAFSLSKNQALPVAFFMALMVLAPIIVRVAERVGFEIGARFWAYASFSWMGLLFLFVSISWSIDLVTLGLLAIEKVRKKKITWFNISAKALFIGQAAFVFAIFSYGLFEANTIRTENVVIESPKIPQKPGKVRIAQISDVHLGLIVKEKRLEKILDVVRAAKPDLLVSTGDLVDGQLNNLTEEKKILAAYRPRLGKIAITGNHEFYAGLKNSLDFTEKAGFTLLRHKGITLQNINFVGVEDKTGERFGIAHKKSERDLLFEQPNNNFTILLKHRPDIDPESVGLFDLQLSGHTHKGQIFPFNLPTFLFYPINTGLTTLAKGKLYLSRGSGTWGPPIRFLAPPEVTIIDLVHGDGKTS